MVFVEETVFKGLLECLNFLTSVHMRYQITCQISFVSLLEYSFEYFVMCTSQRQPEECVSCPNKVMVEGQQLPL